MPRHLPPTVNPEEFAPFSNGMHEIENTLKARLLDSEMRIIKEVSIRDLLKEMQQTPNVNTVLFDGIVTKRLVEAAAKSGIKTIVGVKKGKIETIEGIKVITMN